MAATSVASAPRPLRATLRRHPAAPCRHHHAAPPHALRGPRLAVSASTTDEASSASSSSSSRFYFNFTGFPFPLGPFLNRRTTRTEAVKGSVWLFEQEQALGFSSVSTNTRMTVVKLRSGGLWVHAPIAPTKECIQLIKELGAPVEHIVLPTFAYEHKVFLGPFSRKFPRAQVWVAPRQWSWPVNLPLEFFGVFRSKPLEDEDDATPWAAEIEQKVLSSPEVGIGPYVEVAFYHKPSRTLLVTDAVIFVPRQPPDCISKESLLAAAKNGLAVKILSKGREVPDDPVEDNKLTRQRGWERMVLQILFLGPSNLLEPNASFAQMSQKLIVSPIVKTLVFSKVPEKVCISPCGVSWLHCTHSFMVTSSASCAGEGLGGPDRRGLAVPADHPGALRGPDQRGPVRLPGRLRLPRRVPPGPPRRVARPLPHLRLADGQGGQLLPAGRHEDAVVARRLPGLRRRRQEDRLRKEAMIHNAETAALSIVLSRD
ncbi:hypothetical protein ACQJBY_003409 [Aegilops geniculata]